MSDTNWVDNVTPIPSTWLQAVNNLVYKLFGAADGVDRTPATARNAIKTIAGLTTVAGTNTITATASPAPTAYAADDTYTLIPAVTNTGATTLNIAGLGAKNVFINGAACAGGELVAGVPVIVEYDGTQFNAIGWKHPKISNSSSVDVALNNTGLYFDGPTVAQGTVGRWLVTGSVTVIDSAGAASINVKLWDGTAIIASTQVQATAAGLAAQAALSGVIDSPVGNLRISVKDNTSVNGIIKANYSGNGADSTITAVRIG